MVVISSIDPSEIVVDSHSSKGVTSFKAFLEYCRDNKSLSIKLDGERLPDSDFEIFVMKVLKQAGYKVVPQVGVKGFFIDIGVMHPSNEGMFIMGIECDGATYHSLKSARDRDRIKQHVLENQGWHIYRIWSTDWFNNPQKETRRLLDCLEQLQTLRQV